MGKYKRTILYGLMAKTLTQAVRQTSSKLLNCWFGAENFLEQGIAKISNWISHT